MTRTKFNDISCDDTPRTQPRRYLATCAGISGVLTGFKLGIPGRRQDFWHPFRACPNSQKSLRLCRTGPAPSGRIRMVTSLTVLHYQWVCLLQLYSILVLFQKKWPSTILFASYYMVPVRRDPQPGKPDLNKELKAQKAVSYAIHEVSAN